MPQSLPIIDISQLLAVDLTDNSAELSEATNSVAAQIRDAMEHTGFFYISGYSVESRIIDDVQRAQKNFFSLSTAQKNKSAISRDNRGYLASGMAKMHGAKEHDQKEVFFWGAELDDKHPLRVQNAPLCGPNLWPEDPADFKTAVLNYSRQASLNRTIKIRCYVASSFAIRKQKADQTRLALRRIQISAALLCYCKQHLD